MTSTDGVVIDERLVIKADASGPKSARMVLQNPRVDFAVMVRPRRHPPRGPRVRTATTSPSSPTSRRTTWVWAGSTRQQLAQVKAVIVEAVPWDGFAVLNRDDLYIRQMRRRCSGDVIWLAEYPGTDSREFIERHCRRGGRAVVLEQTERGDMIVIKHGRRPCSSRGPTCCRRPSAARHGSTSPTRWQPPVRHRRGRPAARHPPGPADVHDELLPVSRPDELVNVGNVEVHRLLPQRGGYARDRGLRRRTRRRTAAVRTSPSPRGSA